MYNLAVDDVITRFMDYARSGETLDVSGEYIVYEYFRSSYDPSYSGWYSDEFRFPRSALENLCQLAAASGLEEVSARVTGMFRDIGRCESVHTGSEADRNFHGMKEVELKLRVSHGPYLEIAGFTWPMKSLVKFDRRLER